MADLRRRWHCARASPAIDKGKNADAQPTDQRGFPRLSCSNTVVDLGAFEVQPADTTPPVITVPANIVVTLPANATTVPVTFSVTAVDAVAAVPR